MKFKTLYLANEVIKEGDIVQCNWGNTKYENPIGKVVNIEGFTPNRFITVKYIRKYKSMFGLEISRKWNEFSLKKVKLK